MKKTLYLFLSAAVLLLVIPSCQKDKKWTKHTVIEEYEYVAPQANSEEPQKEPSLWRWRAARMAKAQLKEAGIIKNPIVVPVKTGYYECNDLKEREVLYKLKVNGLLKVDFSEIKNAYDKPTYWVEVALTNKGKALVINDDTPVYPEDTINKQYMMQILNPETGLNQYGEYTFDTNVPEDIKALFKNFYKTYINDKKSAINMYGTTDLIQADQRIIIAKDLQINRLSQDPFLRGAKINAEDIEAMSVTRWTSYVNLYIVGINEVEFCIVVRDLNGVKKIDDVAMNAPRKLVTNKTMRCAAASITAKELHRALQTQNKKGTHGKASIAKISKGTKAQPAAEEKENLQFDEYNPQVQPGIELVERTEPTMYELAKMAEHVEIYNLRAGDYQYKKLGKLRKVKGVSYPLYKATVEIERKNVSALGRIYFKMIEGETQTYTIYYKYDEDSWVAELN